MTVDSKVFTSTWRRKDTSCIKAISLTKNRGLKGLPLTILFVPWRFLVSLVFTLACIRQCTHHLVFFLVLADQQLTAGSEVLYNSVHYKLNKNEQIILQNRFLNTLEFKKHWQAEPKSVFSKRMKARKKQILFYDGRAFYCQLRLRHVKSHKESRFLFLTTGGLLCTSRSVSGPVPSWTNGAVCTRVRRGLERTISSTVRKVHRGPSVS